MTVWFPLGPLDFDCGGGVNLIYGAISETGLAILRRKHTYGADGYRTWEFDLATTTEFISSVVEKIGNFQSRLDTSQGNQV